MKKSAKLSLAIALMMGVTAGSQIAGMNTASAEISDNFKLEINGVTGYVWNEDQLGGDFVTGKSGTDGYWNSYTRAVFTYYVDKDTKLVARLHSGYDSLSTDYANTNESGAYFDQSYLSFRDKKSNLNYTFGKKGAYLGQGLIHNSTGNITGAQVSLGNWYDPQCLLFIYGNKKDGSRFFAANYTKDVVKNWQMSATYINHDKAWNSAYQYDANGNHVKWNEQELHLLSVGSKVKTPSVTLQGEYVRNLSDKVRNGVGHKSGAYTNTWSDNTTSARTGWYVEAFTGPTSDMTSGLPLEKVGTEVWSLKYQDIGANAVDSHNTTFFDDAKGWRLDYGKVIRKGISADIAVARMKDKGGNDYNDKNNGKWKTAIVGEIAYKFK